MPRFKPWQSVVTRLITALVLGGVVISIGLGVLEHQRSTATMRLDLTRRIALTTRDLQSVLTSLLQNPRQQEIRNALNIFTANQPISAIRLTSPALDAPITQGDWPNARADNAHTWAFTEQSPSTGPGEEIALDRATLVRAPFEQNGAPYLLELLVDGPLAKAGMQQQTFQRMAMQWLMLAVMLLLALLLVRRWFTGPLSEVVDLVDQGTGPEPLRRLSRRHPGEFGQLASAIAGMLEKIDTTAHELAQRERAFEHLYEFAPAAMVSLNTRGRIIECNRRAATLLNASSTKALIEQDAMSLVREADQPLLQEAVDRLAIDETTHCELRLVEGPNGQPIDVAVEATAVRDRDGMLTTVRLSLLDISRSRQLQHQLEDQTRLLNLIIDHMSDAILLVDQQGRVAAFNRKLVELLHCQSESLLGSPYSHERFWDALGVYNKDLFINRLRQIEAEPDRPAQERFETRAGVFQFQGIPLHDATRAQVGRLWVVQETTPQEQSAQLLRQQQRELSALKQISQALADADGIDQVLRCAAEQLYNLLGVEAVGLVLRNRHGERRCRQIMHRGLLAQPLQANQALADTMQRDLMPLVLHNDDVAFWPDLPRDTPWGRAGEQAGLTCFAAGPLRGPHERVGVIWAARRGGERLEHRHLHLMETLIPTIAARLHIAELEQRMRTLALADSGTDLPNSDAFDRALRQATETGHVYAVLVMELDRYDAALARHVPLTDDRAINEVVKRAASTSRRSTLLARLAPSRLALLVPDINASQMHSLAQRLHKIITQAPVRPDASGAGGITVRPSLGVAGWPEHGDAGAAVRELACRRAESARREGGALHSDDQPGTASSDRATATGPQAG